jgi:NADH-quinone oxidoreductase subunit M
MVAMMTESFVPLLPGILTLLGALLSLVFWSRPNRQKNCSIVVSLIGLGAIIGLSGHLTTPPEGLLPLYLLPLTACVSFLGQPVHRSHRTTWIMTLVILGLGMDVLTNRNIVGQICLMLLLGLIILLLYRHHSPLWPRSWWGIGAYGLGALSVVISAVAGPPFSVIASLVACAILLPVVPFHDGHLATLTRLPGSLPSFIVVVLPVVGLHGLATLMPTVPDVVARTMAILALIGTLYAAIKALAQSRVRLRLAYGSLSFFSMMWWFVAATGHTSTQSSVFVSAVGLVTSGLLLAWQVIRTRYGDDIDPQAISGLASTMPQYAVLLSLLALAAMGLPPFGVFAGFMGLLLSLTIPFSIAVLIIVMAWLAASWYIMSMVQQLLFGTCRPDRHYVDLLRTEWASLMIIVLILIALGVTPASLFGSETTAPPKSVLTGSFVWNK